MFELAYLVVLKKETDEKSCYTNGKYRMLMDYIQYTNEKYGKDQILQRLTCHKILLLRNHLHLDVINSFI